MVEPQASNKRSSLWSLVGYNSKPIVHLAGHGSNTPIYFIHAIGGDVGFFRSLAELIGDTRPVYGIQVPSHKINAEFGSSIYTQAQYYVDALVQLQPTGSVILGGWSVGSIIALEMAQILKQYGRNVALLISFDGILYHTGARLHVWSPDYLRDLFGNVRRWIDDVRAQHIGKKLAFKLLLRDWKLAAACRAIERNVAADVSKTFLDETVWPAKRRPLVRALFRAVELYFPKPYDGRVLVYLAKVQPFFHLWQVERCWRSIAPSSDFHSISCMHDNMFRGQAPMQMGLHLREYLPGIYEPSNPALGLVVTGNGEQ